MHNWQQCFRYLLDVSRALEYCHGHGILHLDVKPKNILVDSINGSCKLCDFGNSVNTSITDTSKLYMHQVWQFLSRCTYSSLYLLRTQIVYFSNKLYRKQVFRAYCVTTTIAYINCVCVRACLYSYEFLCITVMSRR